MQPAFFSFVLWPPQWAREQRNVKLAIDCSLAAQEKPLPVDLHERRKILESYAYGTSAQI